MNTGKKIYYENIHAYESLDAWVHYETCTKQLAADYYYPGIVITYTL